MSHYPTQEDELRTREAQADSIKQAEEAKFLSTFQTIPARNAGRLSELANVIVSNFNRIMDAGASRAIPATRRHHGRHEKTIGGADQRN